MYVFGSQINGKKIMQNTFFTDKSVLQAKLSYCRMDAEE
jgi:hypothetical protein